MITPVFYFNSSTKLIKYPLLQISIFEGNLRKFITSSLASLKSISSKCWISFYFKSFNVNDSLGPIQPESISLAFKFTKFIGVFFENRSQNHINLVLLFDFQDRYNTA